MRRPLKAIVPLAVAAAFGCAFAVPDASGVTAVGRAAASCRVLRPPSSLAGTLLQLHRTYERHQPDVHDPKITGPVGRVRLGTCGAERYALASFDARYNGYYFGTEDQPERFVSAPGGAWRDIGNTGGEPCGSAPAALLEAWGIVHSCPA